MSFDFCYYRARFAGRFLKWLGAAVVAAGMILVISSSAFGSILVPAAREFVLDGLKPRAAAENSLESSSAPTNETGKESNEYQSLQRLAKDALSPGGTPSPGTSTSPSSSGYGGMSASALDSAAGVHFSDSGPAVRVAGEQRLLLPTPPGNLLLRPPQAG